jgi:hypothetical protein
MSQIVLTYILTESQLEEYTQEVSEGNDGFPNDDLEVVPAFNFNAPPMIALGVMLENHVSKSVPSFEHVLALREREMPVLLAFHFWDQARVAAVLGGLAADSTKLGGFYESFFSESWDEAGAAMLEAIRFVQSGLERLDETNCWFLLFIS